MDKVVLALHSEIAILVYEILLIGILLFIIVHLSGSRKKEKQRKEQYDVSERKASLDAALSNRKRR